MLWEGKSLGQTQSTLMGRKRLIATISGRPHCLQMAGPQDSWGSRVGRVGRWGWGSGLCCFFHHSADPDNPDLWLSRRNSKPKPQDPSPKLSGKDGLHALFLKQRKRMFIIFWESTGSTGVPKALDPMGWPKDPRWVRFHYGICGLYYGGRWSHIWAVLYSVSGLKGNL